MTHKSPTTLLWFRSDLRLEDNPIVSAAIDADQPTLCVYVWDESSPECPVDGSPRAWWLEHTLLRLRDRLATHGLDLLFLRSSDPAQQLVEIVRAMGAGRLIGTKAKTLHDAEVDARLAMNLPDTQLKLPDGGNLLLKSGALRGQTIVTFTRFKQACLPTLSSVQPTGTAPSGLQRLRAAPLPELPLNVVNIDERVAAWDAAQTQLLRDRWTPGEAAAAAQWSAFLDMRLEEYDIHRFLPDSFGTTRLSPHITFGEITVRRLWSDIQGFRDTHPRQVRELQDALLWREYCYYLVSQQPELTEQSYNPEFDRREFPMAQDELARLEEGRTGFPFVDAAIREMLSTGWMHPRSRQVVASYLTKNLLGPWQAGERLFRRYLLDYDGPMNAINWQRVAGTGLDGTSPLRMIDPVTHAIRFDPEGRYIRRWVGELATFPVTALHKPWEATPDEQRLSGVSIGVHYPRPRRHHGEAQERAQAFFAK